MARNPRPVAVAKAPKAIPNDEFSSPVLGSAWLPCLCLGFLTSEVDSETLVEILVLSEALKNADVETDSDTETLDEADSE